MSSTKHGQRCTVSDTLYIFRVLVAPIVVVIQVAASQGSAHCCSKLGEKENSYSEIIANKDKTKMASSS